MCHWYGRRIRHRVINRANYIFQAIRYIFCTYCHRIVLTTKIFGRLLCKLKIKVKLFFLFVLFGKIGNY